MGTTMTRSLRTTHKAPSITSYTLGSVALVLIIHVLKRCDHMHAAGAHLNLYYGDTVSHIMRFKGKIYFVCDMTTEMNGPVFEHLKDNYDGHFHIFTKYAC